MKKIPTLFIRGDDHRVIDQVHPDCRWVLNGEGTATRKWDGTCCMVEKGKLYKRRAHNEKDTVALGWVPVGDGPEDKWHRLAFEASPWLTDGTYELIGPHYNGNPEKWPVDAFQPHGMDVLKHVSRTFEGLKAYLANRDIEGIVFWHPDGRRAKIKARDYGMKRGQNLEKVEEVV